MILFNLLLRLYPRAFREPFGDEMRRLFVDQRRGTKGSRATALLWMRTIAGMTAAAFREHREGVSSARYRLPVGETIVADLRLTIRCWSPVRSSPQSSSRRFQLASAAWRRSSAG